MCEYITRERVRANVRASHDNSWSWKLNIFKNGLLFCRTTTRRTTCSTEITSARVRRPEKHQQHALHRANEATATESHLCVYSLCQQQIQYYSHSADSPLNRVHQPGNVSILYTSSSYSLFGLSAPNERAYF